MNLLFVHQSFPGQYRHIIRALSAQKFNNIVALGVAELSESIPSNVNYIRYPLNRGNSSGIHNWLLDVDSKLIRGHSCAIAASKLRDQGFSPDIICAHSGWGEALFLKDIWPTVPLLSYQEFFYNAVGFDFDFDPEFPQSNGWEDTACLRLKNANPLLMLNSSSWNICPTQFQRSSFPIQFQSKISVIHDGIDTDLAAPDPSPSPLKLPDGYVLTSDHSIVTFVNRSIEPYRGCHTFIRAIPSILEMSPHTHIVIVGSREGVSYGRLPEKGQWCDYFFNEIPSFYADPRVHIVGNLSYAHFLMLLKLSSCHVYLTYPFVLSWSLLESMSIGLPIVASATPPVMEVLKHGENSLLFDFFSPNELALSVSRLLSDRELASEYGRLCRLQAIDKYSLLKCVPRQLALIQAVACGLMH